MFFRIATKTKLQTIFDYLSKKWLSHYAEQFSIDLFPDEKKWLTEVSLHSKQEAISLGGNFMLHDLFLAYNFPSNDVIYLFYELKSVKPVKISKVNIGLNKEVQMVGKIVNKTNQSLNDFHNEKSMNPFDNIDYFASKRKAFSNQSEVESFDNNSQNNNNKSLSLFSFSQRMPFKHTENFHSPFSNNVKIMGLNEKSSNIFNENSELSRFLKKNSENGENFPGISQFFDKDTNKNTNNSMMGFTDFRGKTSNSLDEQAKLKKSQEHFQKISNIIDIFSKNQETSFSSFKENFANKK